MNIGVVGLGRMGSAISQRLKQHGFDVVGWDHSTKAMDANAARGLSLADSPRAVAEKSEIVISIITEDNGVRKLFLGDNGFLKGNVTGKLFVDMSTLQPMTSRELAPKVEAAGARLVESPVLGTIPQVRDGKLLSLAAGRPEDIERARVVLDKLARRVVVMGPAGSGYAMKLAVNLGLAALVQSISESLAFGSRQGLTLEQMIEVLKEAPTITPWFTSKIPALMGEPADVTLDLRTLRKDVMSAVATGALTGVPMPMSAGVLASLSAAVAGGAGAGDLADLPRFLREAMVQDFGKPPAG